VTDRDALIIINMIPGIGPIRVQDLLTRFEKPSNILSLSRGDLSSVPGIGGKLADAVISWKESVKYEEEIALVEKAGVKIVTQIDPEYPPLLKEIYDPPVVLYVRGELPDPDGNTHMLGVVGSRRFTHYGRKMADLIASSASFAGWTVVSGLAYGIDAISHQATIDAGGKTIAVLGGGLARIHPQDHIPLARQIVETGGAVISEFPMNFPPSKRSFPMRNRIISGMSHGVLIVEAGIKSGSLITANSALDQGRLVFAVPGQADNPQSKGTNSLIRNGAVITESFEDIVNEFEFLPGMKPSGSKDGKDEEDQDLVLDLSEEEKTIMDILERERELSADQIGTTTEMPTGKLLSTLMQLEMKNLISQLPGKRFAIK
jgi:DNA processing protein